MAALYWYILADTHPNHLNLNILSLFIYASNGLFPDIEPIFFKKNIVRHQWMSY